MEIEKLIRTLHPLERKVLPLLDKFHTIDVLQEKSGLKDVEVMRALQWLQNKSLIRVKEDLHEQALLEENGKLYASKGLPEKRFLEILAQGEQPISEILKKAQLSKDELNSSLGILKGKAAIDIKKGNCLSVSLAENGKKLLDKGFPEQKLLDKSFPVELKALSDEEKFALENLKKRKDIIKLHIAKTKSAYLTSHGRKLVERGIKVDVEDKITPEMLRSGTWKNKEFRRFDIEINVPKIYGGKRHFVKDAIDYIRKLMVSFGFKEMKGPLLQTSFWNFDSLFTAQDHPVRDLQDTFYIKEPELGKLPDKNLVNKVKLSHENGVSGSIGWRYKWNEKEAKKNVLRTHTTVLSARTLAELKKTELPAKFFAIGRCFRNETLDWSHLFEFNQFEGIVVGEVNFRDHIGFLKEFFKKLGFEKARFRPAYFPYTSPSLEIDVFHPIHKKWIELGGAGILRPEVVVPLLGKDIPVLAWGPGFDRIMMDYYNINDMRELYKNDLKKIREAKSFIRY